MSDGFEVDLDQLRSHAGATQGIRSRSAEAADAGTQVTPGGWDNAYGVICQLYPMAMRPYAEECIDVLQRVSQSFGNQADQLSRTADAYQEIEQRLSDIMQKIINELEVMPGHGGRGH